MDKEREIEEMARKICKSSSIGCNFPTCAKCGIKDTCKARIYATRAISAGYGDTKQAVREFAEKVKERLEQYRLKNEEQTESGEWQLDSSQFCVEVVCNGGLIDELLAEVTGE